MTKPLFILIGFALTILSPLTGWAGEIDVLSWQLSTAVDNFLDRDSDISFTPQTPYQMIQSANLGPTSTAMSEFDIVWGDRQFDFQMDATHQLMDVAQIHSAFSRAAGSIRLQSSLPLSITFDLEYFYNIPGSTFESSSSLFIGDRTNDVLLFGEAHEGGPLDLEPPTGTFNIQGTLDIPAGIELLMSYSMRIRTVGGNSSVVGNADGSLSIQIQTIPEPHTLLLLALVTPLAMLRRHRRCAAPHNPSLC